MNNLLKKWIFYSSISLSGSGYRMRIRIQPGDFNPDPQHCFPLLKWVGTGRYRTAPCGHGVLYIA